MADKKVEEQKPISNSSFKITYILIPILVIILPIIIIYFIFGFGWIKEFIAYFWFLSFFEYHFQHA